MCKCFLGDRYNTKILMCFWEIDKLVIRGSKKYEFPKSTKGNIYILVNAMAIL